VSLCCFGWVVLMFRVRGGTMGIGEGVCRVGFGEAGVLVDSKFEADLIALWPRPTYLITSYLLSIDRPTDLPTYRPTYLPTYLPTYVLAPHLPADLRPFPTAPVYLSVNSVLTFSACFHPPPIDLPTYLPTYVLSPTQP